MDKITHANAFGGVDMAVHTVENLLQIPIDHYAIAKFDGLKDIVDALGGIEVDVTFTFDFTEKGRHFILMNTISFERGRGISLF